MTYCHVKEGKPPAEIDWTVTADHCSEPDPSPVTGGLTIGGGECTNVQAVIPIPNDVCARSDATLKNESDGCGGKHHEASGQLCILPAGEHSVCDRRTRGGFGDYARFFGYLEPASADFSGRTVKESRLSVNDPCYISWKPGIYKFDIPTFLNSGTWTVGSENRYGSDDMPGESKGDTIGGGDLFPYSTNRAERPLPCEVTGQQVMLIQCGNGTWHAYETNLVRIVFHKDNIVATVHRDGESSDDAPLYQ